MKLRQPQDTRNSVTAFRFRTVLAALLLGLGLIGSAAHADTTSTTSQATTDISPITLDAWPWEN